jgi:uncharacterized protein YjiS (DUF1127 family)
MLPFITRRLHALTTGFAAWRQRRRAYDELYALDDRSLADIGISRSEIPYVLARRREDRALGELRAANRGLPRAA